MSISSPNSTGTRENFPAPSIVLSLRNHFCTPLSWLAASFCRYRTILKKFAAMRTYMYVLLSITTHISLFIVTDFSKMFYVVGVVENRVLTVNYNNCRRGYWMSTAVRVFVSIKCASLRWKLEYGDISKAFWPVTKERKKNIVWINASDFFMYIHIYTLSEINSARKVCI